MANVYAKTALPIAVLLGTTIVVAGQEGNAEVGKSVFMSRCSDCHNPPDEIIDPNTKPKPGPSLKNLIGRTAGTIDGYAFSDAMMSAAFVWDEAKLKAYLLNPKAVVPKNRMAFNGLKREGELENLIEYLKQ